MTHYTGKDVSVILPYVREEGALRCLAALKEVSPDVEIVAEFDPDRVGPARMIKRLVAKTTRPLVCFLADDTVPEPGFLEAALRAMESLPDGWGVVGLSDFEDRELCSHWVAHKNMLGLLGGEFHHTGYKHCYGSNELWDRSRELGRYIKAWDAKIQHDNPTLTGKDFSDDVVLMNAYGPGSSQAEDLKLYRQRKRERLKKIAIGFPLVDSTVPVQFFTSFSCMEKPSEYTLLVPKFAHGPWAGSIADARNSLVEQALNEGAEYLLMLDTDQVYPAETLTKLLSHKLDICGVKVHRRWMPFDPIFYRGSLGKYKNVSDEEAYSGEVIEVDATGTGCLLFNMNIFDNLCYPWFQFGSHEGKPVGEDIMFCHNAREAGIKIHVDTSVEVGHLTTIEVNRFLHQICKQIKTG